MQRQSASSFICFLQARLCIFHCFAACQDAFCAAQPAPFQTGPSTQVSAIASRVALCELLVFGIYFDEVFMHLYQVYCIRLSLSAAVVVAYALQCSSSRCPVPERLSHNDTSHYNWIHSQGIPGTSLSSSLTGPGIAVSRFINNGSAAEPRSEV